MTSVAKPQGNDNPLVGKGNHKKRMTPHESEREQITWRIGLLAQTERLLTCGWKSLEELSKKTELKAKS
jgi:hypothetical protein